MQLQHHHLLIAVLVGLLAFADLPRAWPWPPNIRIRDIKALAGSRVEDFVARGENLLPKRDINNLLYGRADETSTTKTDATTTKATAADSSETASASASSGAAASSTDTAAATTTGTASKTASGTGTSSATGTGKTTGKTTSKTTGTGTGTTTGNSSTSYDYTGGVSMITPATGTSEYFKIGDWVTFAWNYTSLSVSPSAINVMASCSENNALYTIATNLSVDTTNKVLWNTNDTATNTKVLLTETYTLIIYNADSSISATAAAGYLGVASTYTFGMYQPQSYTPRSEWTCPSCNSAGVSSIEKQTVGFLLGTFAVTVATFTWFVVGFGIV